MAINFEAANMAGYNNPQIEVFKAVPNNDGTGFNSYPDASIILNCLSRGSFPVIMLSVGTAGYLLPFSDWDTNEIGTTMIFSTLAGTSSSTKIQIIYPDNGGTPTIKIE